MGLIALTVVIFFSPNINKRITHNQVLSKEKLLKTGQVKFESEHEKFVEEGKFDEPNKFNELQRMFKTKVGEDKPQFRPNYKMEEFLKAKRERSKYTTVTTDLDWIERGPANVGGRTRGLIVDPDDPSGDTWFTGSVGGGVWKTTNAGVDWIPLTEDIPALSTVSLAMAASNHNVIYAGTGEGYFNADAVIGQGIFKTTDKGNTWTQLTATATPDFYYVNRMVVDPSDENVILAATNNGIYKSTDGGNTWVEKYSSNSRTQHIIANPENFSTLYCAENGRGVLKSTDAGETWSAKSLPSQDRYEIAISPTDTSRLYAANENNILYMTMNAGESWIRVNEEGGEEVNWLSSQGWYDNTIAVHPYDENVVFVGGIDIWRMDITVDSLLTITDVTTDESFDTTFLFSNKGLPKKNGGVGTGIDYWDEEVFDPSDLVEIELRTGPGVSQMAHRFLSTVYFYQDYVEIPFEVWDVTNNRQLMVSFEDIDASGDFNLKLFGGDILYVNAEEYDPNNPSPNITTASGLKYKNIYVVSLGLSIGKTWDPDNLPTSTLATSIGYIPQLFKNSSPVTDGYNQYGGVPAGVHVDQHNLVMIPVDESTGEFRILNGNDGGVGISNDGGVTWDETDQAGYNTSQFYGFDKRDGANEYLGGTQDNGTWQSQPGVDASKTTDYLRRLGGDGFEVAWHYDDPLKMIGGSQYNTLYRTTDGWASREAANTGFDDWSNSGNSPFISKIAKSNSDPDLVFTISRQGVWRSDNFAKSWKLTPISTSLLHSNQYFSFANVEVSIADPQVVWAGAYISGSGRILVSQDGGLTFTPTSTYQGLGLVSGISTHPTDPGTAYATFGVFGEPKILKTTNYGSSWEDITGFESGSTSSNGFPDVTVYDVTVMPYDTDIIWAGTEIGLFETTDGGQNWYYADNGLPAVAIWDMRVVNDQVVVGTHGRGIWSVTLPELSGYEPPVVTKSPRLESVDASLQGLAAKVTLRSPYDSTVILVNGEGIKTIGATSVKDTSISFASTEVGEIDVQIESFKDGRGYLSAKETAFSTSILDPALGYANNLDVSADDFYKDGLTLATPSGFDNAALHSAHPYEDGSELIALLRIPIIVASENATFSYKDIAIVEPGDPGTTYGDESFWDYVVVEAFNGVEWAPLEDGYDARYNSDWLSAYNSSSSGSSDLYVNHSINLLDHYNAGDTILVRFRMFADQFVNGWGWAIDDVDIQGQLVGVKDDNVIPQTFTLNQNYPNPFNPSTIISYSIPKESKVTLKIYSLTGELVETLVNDVKSAGTYKVEWQANVASGVYFYKIAAGDFVQTKKMILLK